jgi:hypothetical protein
MYKKCFQILLNVFGLVEIFLMLKGRLLKILYLNSKLPFNEYLNLLKASQV